MYTADLQLAHNKTSTIIWSKHWSSHLKKDSSSSTNSKNATKPSSSSSSKKYTKKCIFSKKANSWLPNTPLASLTSLTLSAFKSTLIRCPTSVAAWCPKPSVWESKNWTQLTTWNKKILKVATSSKAKRTFWSPTETTQPLTSQHYRLKSPTLTPWMSTIRKSRGCSKTKSIEVQVWGLMRTR